MISICNKTKNQYIINTVVNCVKNAFIHQPLTTIGIYYVIGLKPLSSYDFYMKFLVRQLKGTNLAKTKRVL